jgi:hypothetical protein
MGTGISIRARRSQRSTRRDRLLLHALGPLGRGGEAAIHRSSGTDRSLIVHHRRYPAILSTETVDDLTALCEGPWSCHAVISKAVSRRRKRAASQVGEGAVTAAARAATCHAGGTQNEKNRLVKETVSSNRTSA